MSSSYRLELDRFLQNLDVAADRVLDIGGSQLPVKGRTKSWKVNEYFIADLEQPHKDSPAPDIILDLNSRNTPVLEEFDLIFCLEVFDYVYDPVRAFKTLHSLLMPGGCAWVSFPFIYPLHQPIEDDSLRYTATGIARLAERTKLQVEDIFMRKPESNLLDEFYRTERMRAAKHYDHNVTGFIARLGK